MYSCPVFDIIRNWLQLTSRVLILYTLATVDYQEKVPTTIFTAVAKAFSDTNQFQGSTEDLRDRLAISLWSHTLLILF